MSTTADRRDRLVQKLFDSSLGMGEVLTVYLGDKLGLYEALRDGPATAPQLAARANVFERYAREWLEQQAAAGILDVDDASAEAPARRYSISHDVAEVLLDPESVYSMTPMAKSFVALAGAMPDLLAAFRTGGPVTSEGYGGDAVEAQGDFNRPWLVRSLATEYLPSVPDLDERLRGGAAVADVACGVGWASISIAKAYPAVMVDGFDLDELSIALANENAKQTGGRRPCRVPSARRGRPSVRGAIRSRDRGRGDPRPLARGRGARGDPPDAEAGWDADRRRRARRGRFHGAGERDRATLLRLPRPVLPPGRDGRAGLGRDGNGDAALDVRARRDGSWVRGRDGTAVRPRLPSVLPARSLGVTSPSAT